MACAYLTPLFAFVLLLSQAPGYGQSLTIRAGGNQTATRFFSNGTELAIDDVHLGFHLGAELEMPITEATRLMLGCYRVTKGYHFGYRLPSVGFDNASIAQKFNLRWLEVPFRVRAYFSNGTVKPFAEAGGFAAIGLGGSYEERIVLNNDAPSVISRDVAFGTSSSDDIRGVDAGLMASAGVRLGHFDLALGFHSGQVNLTTVNQGTFKLYSQMWTLSIAYVLSP
jgi:hypothetical protein